jgi:hypothetical protein
MRVTWTIRDGDIRSALKRELRLQHADDPDTVLIEEMSVLHGASRVDLAVVNGSLAGYEVKSDRDTLERLQEQAHAFSSVFDFVTLVIGERHLIAALDLIPDWWGIKVARIKLEKLLFCDLKLPISNPCPSSDALVRLLWHDEALSAIRDLSKSQMVPARYTREHIYALLAQHPDSQSLRQIVRQLIKNRVNLRPAAPLPLGDD